ncbi:MAG TPA: ATP-binding protein [Chthonomonadaceae bacterium]|nr:ATP-binding protein [Chthonomonadaceae bacterium]
MAHETPEDPSYLESVPDATARRQLDRISRIILSAPNIESLLSQVAQEILDIFQSDRAWLLTPCDPDSPSWRVPIEVTRPEYPGAFAEQAEVPMDPFAAAAFRAALESAAPITHDFEAIPDNPDFQERFRIRSQMTIALRPRIGNAWMLGIHQCSQRRPWSGAEQELFREIAERITDSLSTLILLRQLETDIAERKRVEEELRTSRAMLQLVIDTIPLGVFWKDRNSAHLGVNRTAAEAIGFADPSQVLGKADHEFPNITREQANFFMQKDREVIETNTPQMHIIETMRLADGTMAWLETNKLPLHDAKGEVVGVLGTWADITERRKLEEQLRQAQKLESIGRLAGGVAHDFNNLLTPILGYTELALDVLSADHPIRNDLLQIEIAARRASDLTRQLLAFARRQLIEPRAVNLNDLLLNMDKMLRRLIGEDIELVTLAHPDLWAVKVDPGQMEQVLVNLAVNSRDAMPQGGKLTLETANVYLDAEYARRHPEVAPGEYVLMAVSDTGIGMEESIQKHIFEPFFTTKEQGKGTGLGLATCHGIVNQSGGHIWLYSEPGRGTCFKIYLPRTREDVVSPAVMTRPPLPRGSETILLVEDDDMVRAYAGQALRTLGYTVFEASDGAKALVRSANHPGEIHLLLTDVVMPLMSGRQLAEQLERTRPGLRILYASGYTDNTIIHHGVLDAGVTFLQKPYTHSALAQKVREVLDT